MKESVSDRVTSAPSNSSLTVSPLPAPVDNGRFPMGVVSEFQKDPLAMFVRVMHEKGDFVKVRYGPAYAYHVTHPDYVKRVLLDNNQNYIREQRGAALLKLMTGDNVLTYEGDEWRTRRRLLQPAFLRKRINGFATVMTDYTAQMLERWASHPTDTPLDVDKEMQDVTFSIAGLTLFGMDLRGESSDMGNMMTVSSEFFSYRAVNFFAPPLWVPTKRNREFKAATANMADLGPKMVRERRAEIAEKGMADETGRPFDMMDLLLEARYEDTDGQEAGNGLTDEEVNREINMMLGAGHETTANSLSWTFYLLSQHPELEAKLQHEIDSVLDGRTPTVEDLAKLRYTKMVLNESLRMYPAAYLTSRESIEADQLGPYHLPAGAGVLIPRYAIQRHPAFWDDPDQFDPERFAPENESSIHKFAFFPFGRGPRQCIGEGMAFMEAQLVLAMIVQRYQLTLVPDHVVETAPMITLRMKNGLKMMLEKR